MQPKQETEEFFGEGTIAAKEGKSLEKVITRRNKDGWKIDQVVTTAFKVNQYGTNEMVRGVVLCTKVE